MNRSNRLKTGLAVLAIAAAQFLGAAPAYAAPAYEEVYTIHLDAGLIGEVDIEFCAGTMADLLPVVTATPWYSENITPTSLTREQIATFTIDYVNQVINDNYIRLHTYEFTAWPSPSGYGTWGVIPAGGTVSGYVAGDDTNPRILAVVEGSCTGTTMPIGVPLTPELTFSTDSLDAVIGTAITPVTAEAANFSDGAIIAFSVDPALPAGLAINPADGSISGTPTAATASATYTVTATNTLDSGETAEDTIDIEVIKADPNLRWLGGSPEIVATYGNDPATIFGTWLTSDNTDTGTLSYVIGDTTIAGQSGGTLSFLKPGTTTINVTQAADDTYLGDAIAGTLRVDKQASTTGLAADEVLIGEGEELTLTATVAPADGGRTPTGTVTFTADGSVGLGSAPVGPGGTAELKTSALTAGNRTIAASYSGDDYYLASASTDDAGVEVDGSRPGVSLDGPTDRVTAAFTVTVTFTEDVDPIVAGDVGVTGGTITGFVETTTNRVWTVTVEPDGGGTVTVSVSEGVTMDMAGNLNTAATPFVVEAGSPATRFEDDEAVIRETLRKEAIRNLANTLKSNRRASTGARNRFIDHRQQGNGGGEDTMPMLNSYAAMIDGTFSAANGAASGNLAAFQPFLETDSGAALGLFGDFNLSRDDDGSISGQLTGRLSRDQMIGNDLMLGAFMGIELGRSALEGTYSGGQDTIGVTVGGTMVAALAEGLYLDGFVTLGLAQNHLELSDGTLDLVSDYLSTTGTIGAALTGVIEMPRAEIRPEISASLGHTRLGDVGFTGTAYGLIDETLTLDADAVTIGTIMLRPEMLLPLDGLPVAQSGTVMSLAPRLACEFVYVETLDRACGTGAEIGYTHSFDADASLVSGLVQLDRLGDTTSIGIEMNLDVRF
ncbi:Ig-like domain repeat protein [Cucumibacter marinus]|uniref:Ig-like domain repeat protein n=1 Tax=Cucumibacter marinus TaxID=1121252 RepID=UPI000568FD9C|nr:Ig-like domain repeat protein [Cucumibacter marinus]